MSQQLQPGQPITVNGGSITPTPQAPVPTVLPHDDSSNDFLLSQSQPQTQNTSYPVANVPNVPFMSDIDDEDFDLEDETFVENPTIPEDVQPTTKTASTLQPPVYQYSQPQSTAPQQPLNSAASQGFTKPTPLSLSLSKMPEDQRREVISRLFKLVIGKEPQEKDFNYYRFSALSEDGLIRNLLNTQDHKKMIDQSSQFGQIQTSQKDMELKVKSLEMHLASLQQELKTLQEILAEKNKYIQNLRATLQPSQNIYLPIPQIVQDQQYTNEAQTQQIPDAQQQPNNQQMQYPQQNAAPQSFSQIQSPAATTRIPQHQESAVFQSSLPSPIDELKQFIKSILGFRKY
jgi:hypothetical protein